MKHKDCLRRIRCLDVYIDQKIKELESLRAAAVRIGGANYARDPVTGGRKQCAGYTGIVERIVDLEQEIEAEIDRFADERHETINRIQSLESPLYADILFKRYVEYKSLYEIAKELGYSYIYVRELNGRAVQAFRKLER